MVNILGSFHFAVFTAIEISKFALSLSALS